jgi:2-C-methyl-D-erythritol 4-phosphate cytidylyltransferase/2-C-methyl-D-erythritol 2,4-cyclodiphosphate synthase
MRLGGIDIPSAFTLDGHSDADVVLHALVDAMLGSIAAGDIGQHFPPSDLQWKGADSAKFVAHASQLLAQAQAALTFVDVTILCEQPKIAPHRDAMRARIAELCGMTIAQVSVKATTTEKLGFTGRGEGIAAQVSVSVEVPYAL